MLIQFRLEKASIVYKQLKILIAHLHIFSNVANAFEDDSSFSSSLRSIQNQIDVTMSMGEIKDVKYPMGLFPVRRSMLIAIKLTTFQ